MYITFFIKQINKYIYNYSGNAAFQAATAAAAAAAALQNKSDEFVTPEVCETNQWAMEEAGFIDGDIQRTARSNEDTGEYPRFGWVDITKEFFESCSELNLGELAQDMLFGLFEAMSAIEMMDPKMDVGMGYNKHDTPPHTFESAVEVIYICYPYRLSSRFNQLIILPYIDGCSET